MTATNPLPKAIHAAWCELTTPEAQLWYKAKASQAQTTATFASTIAHKAFATIGRWLKQKPEQVLDRQPTEPSTAIVQPINQDEDLHGQAIEPAEVDAIIASDQEAVEPTAETLDMDEEIDANISELLDQEDDPIELRPTTEDLAEESLEDCDDLDETSGDEVDLHEEFALHKEMVELDGIEVVE